MLTLYTAIGYLKFKKGNNKQPLPVIINNGQDYGMTENELLLWSCLAFQILQIHELEVEYESRLAKNALPDSLPFSHYLNRLILRGLIVKGEGLTGVDALYQLLGSLYILPVKDTFSIRFFSCIHLCLEGKIKIGDFSRYLRKETYSPIEEVILKLAEKVPLSTAEMLTSIEKKANIQNEADVTKELYEDSDATCQSLAEDAQVHHLQFPVLQAIGNLYLNKQISFQTF